MATAPKSDISVETMLHETISLLLHYVRCSKCNTITLCSEKNNICTCGNTFEVLAVLRCKSNEDSIVPLSANSVISIFNPSKTKYERVAEVLKDKEKIGLRNISSETWTAIAKDRSEVAVKPNQVKDISNCISLKFNDDEYVIDYKNGGTYYGATE